MEAIPLSKIPIPREAKQALVHEAMVEARRRAELRNPKFFAFKHRYYYDWKGFALDCIEWRDNEELADYQLEILGNFHFDGKIYGDDSPIDNDRQSVRGPHGLGKTAIAAIIILAFALTTDGITDWKIVTTASNYTQLKQYLWPEVHKWAKRLRWERIGRVPFDIARELLKLSLTLSTGSAFAVSPKKPEEAEGAHASRLLYLFDESKIVPSGVFDSAEGAFATAGEDTADEAYAFSISTPGEPRGRFYEIQSRKAGYLEWKVRHVRLDEAIAAGRISREWAENKRKQWGEKSALYQNKVLGEFASSQESVVIPLAWVEAAEQRWYDWQESIEADSRLLGKMSSVACDVAEGGEQGDATMIAPVFDHVRVAELREVPKGDLHLATQDATGVLVGLLKKWHGAQAIVDAIGIGLGVLQNLQGAGLRARGFKASYKTQFKDAAGELGFKNWRSASWWILREMLAPGSGFNVCLPPDEMDRLKSELTAPKWKTTPIGEIYVETKEEVRVLHDNNSTDAADAVIMALIGPVLCDEFDAREVGNLVEISYIPNRAINY